MTVSASAGESVIGHLLQAQQALVEKVSAQELTLAGVATEIRLTRELLQEQAGMVKRITALERTTDVLEAKVNGSIKRQEEMLSALDGIARDIRTIQAAQANNTGRSAANLWILSIIVPAVVGGVMTFIVKTLMGP